LVDLVVLQTVSYLAGAIGVLIAAVSYATNLRVSQRNQELTLKAQQQTLETRKLQFVTSITSQLLSEARASSPKLVIISRAVISLRESPQV
jgi:hypothetical protein